ncbi:hypothetical protein EDB80DRAFT_866000 [Ilyonectria destructans]|nr:hypothetical protein EDB80DRAFT_866000 [Ilyonectria destructans]
MPHTTREASRLQKHLVQVPARWTDDQTKFLRFSFPSCPTIMPTATAACGHEDGLSEVRWQLAKQRFSFRHSAIAELLTSPTCPFKSSNNLIFQFGRREQPLNCVVLSPRNAHQRKVRISAFVDEGCIRRTRLLNAKSPRQRQALRLDQYHPYITALLIAVAQAQDDREESGYVTASVLFTRNSSTKDVRDVYLYTAKIPLSLLNFLERPKSILPTYDPISVSCVSIPVEPLESLRERIVTAMSSEAPGHMEHQRMAVHC